MAQTPAEELQQEHSGGKCKAKLSFLFSRGKEGKKKGPQKKGKYIVRVRVRERERRSSSIYANVRSSNM